MEVEFNSKNIDDLGIKTMKGDEGMTETNAKIHVLADETLGGIKREYVEVDRKAEVGEKIITVESCKEFEVGEVFTVTERNRWYDGTGISVHETGIGLYHHEYRGLKPTDIVHIDGPDGTERYELTDRKAEVGEKVMYVNESGESYGIVTEVIAVGAGVVDVVEYEEPSGAVVVGMSHDRYRVLVPVEAEADEPQPADLIDVVSNLAARVGRLHDEIDTLHKDNRTLGEELARLQEPKETEELAPIDAPLVFVQRKIGDAFDVYQDGKKLRGVRHIRIDAAVGEFTTHDIECFTGAESEEERP